MNNKRASLGFDDDNEQVSDDPLANIDLAKWEPENSERKRVDPIAGLEAAKSSGFVSREPARDAKAAKPRRRRTGRTAQINIKTKPEYIQKFYDLADANDLGLGQAFEMSIELLELKLRQK
jgi:hypothetical protein